MPESNGDSPVLWTHDAWRCEYLKSAGETGWIILYHGAEIVLRRPARTSEDVKEAAREWRRSIQLGVTVGVPEPTRRRLPDRRRVMRGGRRADDRARSDGDASI